MTEKSLPALDISEAVSGDRVVLVGGRGRLRGQIRIRNAEDQKIQLRSAELRCEGLRCESGVAGASIPIAASAMLGPKQERLVDLMAEIDPRTAPGDYTGELTVSGSRRTVEIHVAESIRPRFSPSQIVIVNVGERKAVKRVYLTNDGNIPITVRDHYRVQLGEEILSVEFAEDGQSRDALQLLSAVLVSSRPILKQAGVLEVRTSNEAFDLPPGETRSIDLELYLPEDMDPESRYIGKLRLYTADLEFVITPAFG